MFQICTVQTSAHVLQLLPFLLAGEHQCNLPLRKTATIHQLTTILSTSKNVLSPGHNHQLTTSADDPVFTYDLIITLAGAPAN